MRDELRRNAHIIAPAKARGNLIEIWIVIDFEISHTSKKYLPIEKKELPQGH